jgi:predicted ATP-grasp superfamily ATP-dependent carboligase/protein-tyrosine-phosphatase
VVGDKVLVLGDDTRSFLTIVRSLGRWGITIHAVPANARSPALRSRYIAAIHHLPPWLGEGSDWLAALLNLIRIEQYQILIPCNETTLLPMHRHRATLSRFARLAIPDEHSIRVLFDKHATRELARESGVPTAPGRLLQPDDTAEELVAEFGAPIVLKPRNSYSEDRLATRAEVHVLRNADELSRALNRINLNDTIIEQFFPGKGIGISVLSNHGRVLQAFEHHRVREISGASFYRCSAPLNPSLLAACEKLVAALEYTGLAMFEFKQNSAGDWILLEVNARPWGSMPLPVALGVDFPYRWYRLLVAGEELPAVDYRTGIYGRNLIPDFRNSLIEAKQRQLGTIATGGFMAGRLIELFRLFSGREQLDVWVRDDIWPGLAELVEFTKAIGRKIGGLLPGCAARRSRRARAILTRVQRRGGTPRIIFVCQGNICRSPFAEVALRSRVSDAVLEVSSAGIIPLTGRPTPLLGLQAASARGFDLSTHRSVWLTRQMADAASLLIVFDEITHHAVLDRYPDLKAPIIRLGDLRRLGNISDPVDGGSAEFARAYDHIESAIAELMRLIADTRRS